ncbi:ATP-dependent endonuclease [bacterium]|nr:ATP-dependent endonuclease [bacterium]
MKYKKLTKEQIIISLDRLTRFKNTREKYLRVYSDILITCLIEPKLKKTDIENMDFFVITEYVTEIINNSIPNKEYSIYINKILLDYENSIFNNDNETQKLLNNKINYLSAVNLMPEDCSVNLKWLKKVAQESSSLDLNILKKIRAENLLKYPIEVVFLVEGITEEILLPVFGQKLGYDFYANGVQIIPAGGKNQVVKMYYKLASELKIPIFVLLDKDAEENINQIKPKLREQDKIHLVSCGEFEDLLPKSLIVKTVNSHFKNFLTITELDLDSDLSTVKVLEEVFKKKGLHEFKKADFAKLVKENIDNRLDISPEIADIIEEISYLNKKLDSKFCS